MLNKKTVVSILAISMLIGCECTHEGSQDSELNALNEVNQSVVGTTGALTQYPNNYSIYSFKPNSPYDVIDLKQQNSPITLTSDMLPNLESPKLVIFSIDELGIGQPEGYLSRTYKI